MGLLECFRSYCLEHSEKYRVFLKLQIHQILRRPKEANEANTLFGQFFWFQYSSISVLINIAVPIFIRFLIK